MSRPPPTTRHEQDLHEWRECVSEWVSVHDASIGENLPSDPLFKDAYCCFGVYRNIHIYLKKEKKCGGIWGREKKWRGEAGHGDSLERKKKVEIWGMFFALRENTCVLWTGLHPRCVGGDVSAQPLLVRRSVSTLEPLAPVCFRFSFVACLSLSLLVVEAVLVLALG